MSACSSSIYEKSVIDQEFISKVSYDIWSEENLIKYASILTDLVDNLPQPVVLIFEIGHFSLPLSQENIDWAAKNVEFANILCGKLINKYKKKIRIIPTLLINNLDSKGADASDIVIEKMFAGNKYIDLSSVEIISERNLKNRAYKSVKKISTLTNSIMHKDGKAYLRGDKYQNDDLPVGFLNEKGDIIPRCGLIITSYLDKVISLAKNRMHQHENPHTVLVSFSQHGHEYDRVKLGVDTYAQANHDNLLSAVVSHWAYMQNKCDISYRKYNERKWHDE